MSAWRVSRSLLERIIRPVFLIVIVAPLFAPLVPTSKFAEKPSETRVVETVAPGVEHIIIRRGDFSEKADTDRWTIHALVLDPSRVRLELGRAMDEGVGTETVALWPPGMAPWRR